MAAERLYPDLTVRLPARKFEQEIWQSPKVTGSLDPASCTVCEPGSNVPWLAKLVYPADDIRSNYLLGPSIGKGHSGVVRKCQDLMTGEWFACKSIPKSKLKSMVKLAELAGEIEAMRRLKGCGKIVQLKGLYEDKEAVHLVMDLCASGDMFEFLSQREQLSEADTAHLLRQVAIALKQCAANGVIHRDVKPENIFISSCSVGPEGTQLPQVKLGDFGLAAVLSTTQRTTEGVAGSCPYMAPELVQGMEYDHKIDIWSLGVTIYAALCGFLPFWGATNNEVFINICAAQPDYAEQPWLSISAQAKHLVQWMLAPNPKDRATADDILSHPWLRSIRSPVNSPRAARHLRWPALLAIGQLEPLWPHPPRSTPSLAVQQQGSSSPCAHPEAGIMDCNCKLSPWGSSGDSPVSRPPAVKLSPGYPESHLCKNAEFPAALLKTPHLLPAHEGFLSSSPLLAGQRSQEGLGAGGIISPRPPASPRSLTSSPTRHARQVAAGGGIGKDPVRWTRKLSQRSEVSDNKAEQFDSVLAQTSRPSGRLCSGASRDQSCDSMSPAMAATFFRGLDSPCSPLDARFFGAASWQGNAK